MKKITKVIFLVMMIIFTKTGLCDNSVNIDTVTIPIQYCEGTELLTMSAPVPIGHGMWQPPSSSSTSGNTCTITESSSYNGEWTFSSPQDNYFKTFYLYFVTPMTSKWAGRDTMFCGINFILNPQATALPGTKYLWSTGATTATITLVQGDTGWFSVTITNACNSITDSIHVLINPNTPNLGQDFPACSGTIQTLNAGSGYNNYLWSTGAVTQTLAVDTTGIYTVTITDGNGCHASDAIHVEFLEPISEEICYVEFDTASWWNDIKLKVPPSNADSIKIYKLVSLNTWDLIGTVDKTMPNFLDSNSNPEAQSYSYKIGVIDTCGNESVFSSYHTTITLLSTYDQGTDTYGFTWSAYYGLIVNEYKLYGIKVDGTVILIGTVPGNQYFYNYINPDPAFIKFFIGFDALDCLSKNTVIVKSNWVESLTGIRKITAMNFSFYPNPATDVIHIKIATEKFQVEVKNMLGQVILSEYNTKVLDISSLQSGMYIISIKTDNNTITKKFSKL